MAEPTAAAIPPRFIALASPAGHGNMAVLDFGPQDQPVGVVFLHANGFNAATYRQLLTPLADRMRLMAIDQRGHGASQLTADPVGRRSWRDLRDDLITLLMRFEGPPPVVAGHSMGGTVALLVAAKRPDLVRKLVLFDPVVLPRRVTWMSQIPLVSERLFARSPMVIGALKRRADFPDRAAAFAAYKGRGAFKTWPDKILADYISAGFRDTPTGVTLSCTPAWEASNFGSQGHNPWAAAARLQCQTTLLRAERGSTCRIDDGRGFGRTGLIDQAVISDTSHFLPMERPDLVEAALFRALSA